MDAIRCRFEYFKRLLVGDRAADNGEGCSGLECLSVIAVASLLRSACFLVSTSSSIFSARTHR